MTLTTERRQRARAALFRGKIARLTEQRDRLAERWSAAVGAGAMDAAALLKKDLDVLEWQIARETTRAGEAGE